MPNKPAPALREPETPFQRLVRDLAEAAMNVTHHDIGDHEPEYIHEIQHLERAFAPKIRGFMTAEKKRQRS